ncbi:hypothetical protein SSX86_007560 [Deinandra increscens subsp. villosa]|uniref:Uncharacterized protein n=1 Tax=Deinandra increscens subsp. villosa TaxID=3103831 RepID=A0AAP0DEX7_9ASTR
MTSSTDGVICISDSSGEEQVVPEYSPSPEDYMPSSPEAEIPTVGTVRLSTIPSSFLRPLRPRVSDDTSDHPSPTAIASGAAAAVSADATVDPFARRRRSVRTYRPFRGAGRRGFTPGRGAGPSRRRAAEGPADEPVPKRHRASDHPHLAWIPGQLASWRTLEGVPSLYEPGDSSTRDGASDHPRAGYSVLTGEPIADTVPVLVARTRSHEQRLAVLNDDIFRRPTRAEFNALLARVAELERIQVAYQGAMESMHAHMSNVCMVNFALVLANESFQARFAVLEEFAGRMFTFLDLTSRITTSLTRPPGPPGPPPPL